MKTIKKRLPPAQTPEAREQQLIGLAYDLVEQRLLEGTATSQETTHFLKMGSYRQKLELDKIKHENEMLEAKTESLRSEKRTEELYENALKAMRSYNSITFDDYEED